MSNRKMGSGSVDAAMHKACAEVLRAVPADAVALLTILPSARTINVVHELRGNKGLDILQATKRLKKKDVIERLAIGEAVVAKAFVALPVFHRDEAIYCIAAFKATAYTWTGDDISRLAVIGENAFLHFANEQVKLALARMRNCRRSRIIRHSSWHVWIVISDTSSLTGLAPDLLGPPRTESLGGRSPM